MKKLMITLAAVATFTAFADADAKSAEVETNSAPIFWGFGNYGIYSGYQLYGSLVNSEPTAQGYVEGNVNVGDLGYVGLGLWSNTDLTGRRRHNMSGLFNEWDFNVHFGRTFWFDNDQTWGLEWRSFVQWYYYPPKNYKGSRRDHLNNRGSYTTWDFNHSFALVNPYIVPYITAVREYKKGANLVVFGLKKSIAVSDELTLTPYIESVWRERQYNWCFPTAFNGTVDGYDCNKNSGIATAKIGLDCNWQLTDNLGLFAKVAYCSIVDDDLRRNVDHLNGSAYGATKDYAWGGVGVTFNF